MLLLLPLTLLAPAQAGDPGPICPAVAASEVVVEVGFTATGAYPSAFRRKHWEPPQEAVLPTVATAHVTRVLKGDPGDWKPALEDLAFANQAPLWWDRFYAAGDFQALVLLSRGPDGRLQSPGWIEDSGLCSVSWCWDQLRSEVVDCLVAQGLTVPPAAAPPSVAASPPAQEAPTVVAPAPPDAPQERGWFEGCAGH